MGRPISSGEYCHRACRARGRYPRTLLDTGDFYGMGHSEMLLGEALEGAERDNAVLSVKFGSAARAQAAQ